MKAIVIAATIAALSIGALPAHAELSLQQHDRSMLILLDRLDDSTSELSEEVEGLREALSKLKESMEDVEKKLDNAEKQAKQQFRDLHNRINKRRTQN